MTDKDQSKITVFPLRCGIGKSEYIKQRIFDSIQTNKGIIIVTDVVARMHDYVDSQKDDGLLDYIKRIASRVAILEAETYAEVRKTLYQKPIILMTTQRYFSLTRDEIMGLTTYNVKKDEALNMTLCDKRDVIIFDEKPYITDHIVIDIKAVNDIDSALHMTLDDTLNQSEKDWMIQQWQKVKVTIQNIFKQIEEENTEREEIKLFHRLDHNVTEDDSKFLTLCTKYKNYLNQLDFLTYKKICAVMQIFSEGATVISRKIQTKDNDEEWVEYHSYFHVVADNQEKLINIGAKVFVLDGTADISPEYRVDYVNMVDCSQFLIPLNNLTIDCVNVPTSKTKLCDGSKQSKKMIKGIVKYINHLPNKPEVIFSYKALKDTLDKHFANVNYFGNIKGRNDYRSYTNFVQIGLNRFPQDFYKLTAYYIKAQTMISERQKIDKALGKPPKQYKANAITVSAIGQNYENNIVYYCLLADIEQNIYRSKLRNIDNKCPIHYTILFNTRHNAGLIDKLRERYETLGAKVNVLDCPQEIQTVKTENRKPSNDNAETKPQSVLHWLENRKEGFKLAELLQDVDLTHKALDKITSRHPEIKAKLDAMRTDKRGYYQPKD